MLLTISVKILVEKFVLIYVYKTKYYTQAHLWQMWAASYFVTENTRRAKLMMYSSFFAPENTEETRPINS
jgi:hypothetical protein